MLGNPISLIDPTGRAPEQTDPPEKSFLQRNWEALKNNMRREYQEIKDAYNRSQWGNRFADASAYHDSGDEQNSGLEQFSNSGAEGAGQTGLTKALEGATGAIEPEGITPASAGNSMKMFKTANDAPGMLQDVVEGVSAMRNFTEGARVGISAGEKLISGDLEGVEVVVHCNICNNYYPINGSDSHVNGSSWGKSRSEYLDTIKVIINK